MPIHSFLLTQAITLIEQRTALSAETLRRIGIGELLEQIASGEVESYLKQLHTSNVDSAGWQRLIHSLTIGETYFLRDKRHFQILRESILPRLMLKRRRIGALQMVIWCVGCVTGEEPYSVATTLQEFMPDLSRWEITILGTDLNQRAIAAAREGHYRQWSFRHTPEIFQQRYFTSVDDGYQIDPSIRDLVTFRQHNLLDDAPLHGVDIIFCRNVLMYFGKDITKEVENTLFETLAPGGWLFLGQAEALHNRQNEWTMHLFPGTPIYQKPSGTQPFSTPISYPTRPFVEAVETSDNGDESENYDRAIQAVHEDYPHRAEIFLGRLLAENPKHARAHVLLASIFANRQAYPEAQAHLDEALAIDGLLADAHYIRALIQLEQDETDSAMQSLSAAIYCRRNHMLASFTLGDLLSQRGDIMRAEKNWRNARRALENCEADSYISDLSDMQVTALQGLLDERLED
jgi:chemotaxis protein methyltransferase CheR